MFKKFLRKQDSNIKEAAKNCILHFTAEGVSPYSPFAVAA
jgi:hypothetical protein